jgi:hypothetical protein
MKWLYLVDYSPILWSAFIAMKTDYAFQRGELIFQMS